MFSVTNLQFSNKSGSPSTTSSDGGVLARIDMLSKLVHSANVLQPISVTPDGIIIFSKALHI